MEGWHSSQKDQEQLGMSERGLRNILSYAKKHPGYPVARKSGQSGRPPKVSLGTIMQIKRKVLRIPPPTTEIMLIHMCINKIANKNYFFQF
jgi:hypothetical protein